MLKITKIAAMASLFSAFCFAETWTGKLVDASCYMQNERKSSNTATTASCAPSAATTSFGIQTSDGKFYQLDSTGNGKAVAAMKTDYRKDNATVTGTIESNGKTLKVDSLDLR